MKTAHYKIPVRQFINLRIVIAYSFNEQNKARLEFELTEEFSRRLEVRYRIEEKNRKSKQAHGLRKVNSTCLVAMRLQMFFTAFAVNIKRIVKLIEISVFLFAYRYVFSFKQHLLIAL